MALVESRSFVVTEATAATACSGIGMNSSYMKWCSPLP